MDHSSNLPARSLKTLAVLITFFTSFAPLSHAWGPEGHEIVARIAELHLTPKADQEIGELLATTTTNRHKVHIWYSGVCNWPDFIRHDRTNSAPWHFVDIAFDAAKYNPVRDCEKHGGCVVESITRFSKELADTQTSTSNRVEALKFLVHFVGDVHQPLHCAQRNDDQGGNLCMVTFPGRPDPVKLHYVWDGLLIQRSLADRHLETVLYADYLNTKITKRREKPWAEGTPEEWANESHRLAIRNVYPGIPIQETPFALTEEYVKKNQTLVDTQLIKAGLRLARFLNEAFQ